MAQGTDWFQGPPGPKNLYGKSSSNVIVEMSLILSSVLSASQIFHLEALDKDAGADSAFLTVLTDNFARLATSNGVHPAVVLQ